MLSTIADQNKLGMKILDLKPLYYRALYEPSFENKHR